MIADIFYPIFTLMITILACFIRKKKENCSGDLHPHVHQGIALDSMEGGEGGLTARPGPPSFSIVFGFSKNRCAHIFSVSSPESNRFKNKKFVVLAEYFEQQINCCSLSNKWKPCHRVINTWPRNLRTTLEK